MQHFVRRIFFINSKLQYRFLSKLYKSKKRIITADQQFISEYEDDCIVREKRKENVIHKSRRGISFMLQYEGKSIERVDDSDERFMNAIIKARNFNDKSNDLMLLEGINMICDAIKMDVSIVTLFFTQRELLQYIPYTGLATNAKVFYVTYENMKKMSNLKTPPGILAICKRPNPESMLSDVALSNKLPLTLILSEIKDPGNLGTMIRTAAGFNVHKILLLDGCVALYNERVVRATMGGLFSVPVFEALSWSDVSESLSADCPVYSLDNGGSDADHSSGETFPYYHPHLIDFRHGGMYGLIVRENANAMPPEATQLIEHSHGCVITVPMARRMCSLNCALSAGIVMSHFLKVFLNEK